MADNLKLEIERKFLLLKKPSLKADTVYRVEQHYCGDERIRRKSREGEDDVFYHTIKKNIRPGVNSEDEKKISRDEYYSLLEKSKSHIVKYRHYYFIGKYTFEVDIFEDINLVVMEVEFKDEKESETFKMPKFFEHLVLKEVTDIREFSNKNISKKLNKL